MGVQHDLLTQSERTFTPRQPWLAGFGILSFANYYDPNFMGFSALRVINDDVIDAGQGFGTHPHKDMEILTYVLEGRWSTRDSMGNKEQVPAGEFQIMSAGTGVRHSEYNPSKTDRLRLYQIWIIPEETGITPRFTEQRPSTPPGQTAGAVAGCTGWLAEGLSGYGTVSLGAAEDEQSVPADCRGTSRLDPVVKGRSDHQRYQSYHQRWSGYLGRAGDFGSCRQR